MSLDCLSHHVIRRDVPIDTVYWKTRARTHGHGHLWKRRTVMEKTDSYGKDGQVWKRRTVMEKTGSYGKDGHLWKRRTLMEKTDTYGKDGHKAFETNFLSFKKEAHTVL